MEVCFINRIPKQSISSSEGLYASWKSTGINSQLLSIGNQKALNSLINLKSFEKNIYTEDFVNVFLPACWRKISKSHAGICHILIIWLSEPRVTHIKAYYLLTSTCDVRKHKTTSLPVNFLHDDRSKRHFHTSTRHIFRSAQSPDQIKTNSPFCCCPFPE